MKPHLPSGLRRRIPFFVRDNWTPEQACAVVELLMTCGRSFADAAKSRSSNTCSRTMAACPPHPTTPLPTKNRSDEPEIHSLIAGPFAAFDICRHSTRNSAIFVPFYTAANTCTTYPFPHWSACEVSCSNPRPGDPIGRSPPSSTTSIRRWRCGWCRWSNSKVC